LRAAIATRADLRRLAGNPLLLTMMALLHASKGRLPEKRVELYAECLDLLLRRW
jgi:predicted NACHT family NTPase